MKCSILRRLLGLSPRPRWERLTQWQFYIGARGLSPPKSRKRKDLAHPNSKGGTFFLAGVVILTELIGSAVATYEANEATASVKFVASVKI